MSKHELGDNEGLTALRVMYELNPEGVVFTHADEGRVLAANPAACAILGMTEEEILRRGATASLIQTTPAGSSATRSPSAPGRWWARPVSARVTAR